MIARSKIKNILAALAVAFLLGALTDISPAQAYWVGGWHGHRHIVVYRPVYRRPYVRRVVYWYRPVVYHPRRVVVVGWPYHRRVYYGYGWPRYRYGYAWRPYRRYAWHHPRYGWYHRHGWHRHFG